MDFGQDMSKIQKFYGSSTQQSNMHMQLGGILYMMTMASIYPSMNNMPNINSVPIMSSKQGISNMQNFNQISR